MKLWIGILLLVPLGFSLQQSPPQQLTKAQKDAFLSRKKWYMSYDFTVSGQDSSESGAGETHTKSDWRVGRRTTGVIELNFAIPGQWPPSWTPDPLSLTPGRFISWKPMPSEKTLELIAQGERDPAKLPGLWFPYTPETFDRREMWGGGHHNISTYTLNGVGYTDGTCALHLDLSQNIYEVTFQSQASGLGDKVKHEWRNQYVDEPVVTGSEEMGIQEEFTAWFPKDAQPQLIRRKLLPDLKSDGSIAFSLTGTMDLRMYGKVGYSATFRFSPTPPSTARLYIDAANAVDYHSWRPKAGNSDDVPGNSLDLKYSIEEPGVAPDKQSKVRKVTLRLGNVSKYPGVCMNWPPAPSGPPKADLRFKPMQDTASIYYSMGAENETITIMAPGDKSAPRQGQVTVECFDGAAIGEVVAEAELYDGRVLQGEVRGNKASRKVLIPIRDEGVTDIANIWIDTRASGLKDGEDEENDPVGDGQKGDGLSVWEEYRGFWQGGAWRDNCDPKKKDLFIENKAGPKAVGGIELFKRATELVVHRLLTAKEHRNKLINIHSRPDRHVVDQHCLILRQGLSSNYGVCVPILTRQMGGPPKNTDVVEVLMNEGEEKIYGTASRGIIVSSYQKSHIAHELGHAVGIWHHGDEDPFPPPSWALRIVPPASEILEGAIKIKVVGEPTAQEVPTGSIFSRLRRYVWIGLKDGQHSGNAACIMRYSVAKAYKYNGDPVSTRVWHGNSEAPGTLFCESPDGTDVNGPGNLPHSRYGSAAAGRGDCKHQFVISDRWDAKVR